MADPWLDFGEPISQTGPVKPTSPKEPENPESQQIKFVADTVARALGQFAGWPVDTAKNAANLMLASIGTAPTSLTTVGKYMREKLPSAPFGIVGRLLERVGEAADKPQFKPAPIEHALGSSENITQGYRQLSGLPPAGIAPASGLQNFAGNVGEMAGGGAFSALRNPAKLVAGIDLPNLARLLFSTGGAEVGRETAGVLAPDNRIAEIGGLLVGGVLAPSVLAGRGTVIQNAGKFLSGKEGELKAIAEKMMQKTVQQHALGYGPEAVTNLEEAQRIAGKFQGLDLSLAEASGIPGLAEMQRRYASLTPFNLNREVARQVSNRDVLASELQSRLPPEVTGAGPRNVLNRTLAAEQKRITDEEAAIAGTLGNTSQREAGQQLSEIAHDIRNQAKSEVIKPLYEEAFQEAGNNKIDLSRVIADAEDILGRKLTEFAPETAPATVRKLLSFKPKEAEYKFFGEPVFAEDKANAARATLPQLDDVRKAINADIAAAKSSMAPLADTRLFNLNQLHGSIDAAVAESSLPAAAKEAYDRALATYRNQYVPAFKEGVNYQLFKRSTLNEPRLLPDDVVKTYFQPGGEREASQFVTLFGGNAKAKDVMRAGIEDLYRQKVVDQQTGAVSPVAHNRFMAQYERPIAIMDNAGVGISDKLASVGAKAEALAAGKEALTAKARALRFDDTEQLKASALSSPKVMGQIVAQMRNPEAAGQLARSLIEDAWGPVAAGKPNAASAMLAYLQGNERTIKIALSASESPSTANKHFSDLLDISKGLSMVERISNQGGLGSQTTDPLKRATGVSIPTIWSQWRAVSMGRQGVGTAATMLAAPVLTRLSQYQFDDVMYKALHDPQTANDLLRFLKSSPARANEAGTNLLSRLKPGAAGMKDALGAVGKYWLGTPWYMQNLQRIAPELAQEGAQQ